MTALPDGHDGLDVTNERIRTAHSLMSVEWLAGDEEVHRAYKQGHDERCYICALLAENERLAAQAKWRSEPEIVKTLDALDDCISTLSQSYAHARATMPSEFLNVVKLASSVSLRVRSQYRLTGARGQ